MKTGVCRTCLGKRQAAMKFAANVSPPQEEREEQSLAYLPMEMADNTIVDPQGQCDSCYHRKNHLVRHFELSYLLVRYTVPRDFRCDF